MPKLLLTNAIMTTLTATTRMVITKTMMKIKMVKRWHCGRLKGETSVKTQNPGVTHSSCWTTHTHTCELINYTKHTHTNAYKLMKYEYTHTNKSGELQIRIHTYKQIR